MNAVRSSTRKQVVVRRMDKDLVKGFVDLNSFLKPDSVEVLDRAGRVITIPLPEVKGVFFVRDFDGNQQRSERKTSRSRPRLAGLWVRMTFKDREVLEGTIPNDFLEIDSRGFFVSPLDVYSNNVSMFIPRTGLAAMEVLGVISEGGFRRAPLRPGTRQPQASEVRRQITLFAPSSPAAKD